MPTQLPPTTTPKNRIIAGLLALFLGVFGVHRFYLGQKGLGFIYIALFFFFGISGIIGLIDAIVLLTMDEQKFQEKYNYVHPHEWGQQGRHRGSYVDHRKTTREQRNSSSRTARSQRPNPYKLSGIQKYKDYEFEEAIQDFKKALAVNSKDVAVHFNLACAYSITEDAEKSLYHLDQAVLNGFVDFEKIKEHDALAYLRIQDEFDDFVKNGYRLPSTPQTDEVAAPSEVELPPVSTDLLEQIRKLGELREKGFLTEEEFAAQKKRLLK